MNKSNIEYFWVDATYGTTTYHGGFSRLSLDNRTSSSWITVTGPAHFKESHRIADSVAFEVGQCTHMHSHFLQRNAFPLFIVRVGLVARGWSTTKGTTTPNLQYHKWFLQ